MKIKSPFKDYYDHVEYLYSPEGGDTSIVYNRTKFEGEFFLYVPTNKVKVDLSRMNTNFENAKWLVIMDKLYLVKYAFVNGRWAYRLINKEDLRERGFYSTRRSTPDEKLEEHINDWYRGVNGKTKELSKFIGAPVYLIDHHDYRATRIDVNIPILDRIGIPSIISAEQMYQELSLYMANVLRTSPDNVPPVEVSDLVKIEKHGFDLKRSFRHRPKIRT